MSKTPADEFSIMWDAPPDVFAFLAERPALTPRECADVVAVDQFRRWRAGVPLAPEAYLERLGEIADDAELKLELIRREFEYAQLYGEAPDADEFAACFPDLRDRLLESLGVVSSDSDSAPQHRPDSLDATVIDGDSGISTPPGERRTARDMAERGQTADATVFLAKCDAFSALSPDVLRMIESKMYRCEYRAGQYILRQGDPGTSLLVICDGVVEITTDDEGSSRHFIGRIGKGQVLGEMSLLTEEPRSANAVATTSVRALVLPAELFHELATRYPRISVVLTRLFATRLGGVGRDVLAGKTFGGYRFNNHLGQGGMSVVYEASHIETGRIVALKMMSHRLVYDTTALQQFRREADIIESFEHPNIVKTYGRFAAFHTYFIAMQYCDGYTLEDVINTGGPLSEAEFRRIIGQVAAALDYAHAHNVIHRDIKPANIMLNRDGTVKLMDFGLAKPVDDDDNEKCSIVGTPRYMAPEQLHGLDVCKESDYFGLGCVAYKALTGQTLFSGGRIRQLRREHAHFTIPDLRVDPPGVSIATNWILQQCLQPNPADRRPDMQKIASWAAPFNADLLDRVEADEDERTISEDTLLQ